MTFSLFRNIFKNQVGRILMICLVLLMSCSIVGTSLSATITVRCSKNGNLLSSFTAGVLAFSEISDCRVLLGRKDVGRSPHSIFSE